MYSFCVEKFTKQENCHAELSEVQKRNETRGSPSCRRAHIARAYCAMIIQIHTYKSSANSRHEVSRADASRHMSRRSSITFGAAISFHARRSVRWYAPLLVHVIGSAGYFYLTFGDAIRLLIIAFAVLFQNAFTISASNAFAESAKPISVDFSAILTL